LTDGRAQRLVALGVATLHEAAGRRGLLRGLRLIVGEPFAGPAVTVALPAGDNLGIHLALDAATPGSVVCVASAGAGVYGVIGELLFESARSIGVAGLVVEDGIRDVAAMEAPPGLAALSVSARGTIKSRVRSPVGDGVPIGGVLVASGDWLVCDRDGVVVVPAADEDEVVALAGAREEREATMRERIRAGERTSAILGLPAIARASLDVGQLDGLDSS
jgi:4-hydroxy-4-methyl-2-oxoglutarate aldolase